jgi:Tfp pilus assembly protein PilO
VSAVLKLDSPKLVAGGMAVFLAILSGVTWFALVAPHRADAGKLDGKIAAAQRELTSRQHAEGSAATNVKKAADAGSSARAMPSSPAMPQIVVELNRLASGAGVTLDAISPQPSTQVGNYQSIPLSVVLDGHYAAVESFLAAVRRQVRVSPTGGVHASGRLFDVQKVDLDQTEPAPSLTATLTMQAFAFAPVAAAPAPTPATTTTTAAAG